MTSAWEPISAIVMMVGAFMLSLAIPYSSTCSGLVRYLQATWNGFTFLFVAVGLSQNEFYKSSVMVPLTIVLLVLLVVWKWKKFSDKKKSEPRPAAPPKPLTSVKGEQTPKSFPPLHQEPPEETTFPSLVERPQRTTSWSPPPDDESWKRDFEQGQTTIWTGSPRTITFTYLDKNFTETKRTVDVERVFDSENGTTYLEGYCHLRQESRTFNVGSIEGRVEFNGKRYDPFDLLYPLTDGAYADF